MLENNPSITSEELEEPILFLRFSAVVLGLLNPDIGEFRRFDLRVKRDGFEEEISSQRSLRRSSSPKKHTINAGSLASLRCAWINSSFCKKGSVISLKPSMTSLLGIVRFLLREVEAASHLDFIDIVKKDFSPLCTHPKHLSLPPPSVGPRPNRSHCDIAAHFIASLLASPHHCSLDTMATQFNVGEEMLKESFSIVIQNIGSNFCSNSLESLLNCSMSIPSFSITPPNWLFGNLYQNEENNSGSSSSARSEGKNGEAQKRAKGINLSKSKKRKRKEKEPIQRNEEPNRRTVRPSSWCMHKSITKIRNALRYVRASPAGMKKFKECVEKEKIQSTSMVQLDVPTRWNSTYLMLDSALKFEKAFSRYESQDAHYVLEHLGEGKRRGIPAREDWENARIIVTFLKVFYDVTTETTSSNYFHDFCLVVKTLKGWCESEDENLRRMAERMKEKDDSFGKIFDVEVADSMSWKVKNGLYKMDMNEEDNPENKSEIDQYLLEPREKMSSQFDILNWWKVNSTKFPILALIARDVSSLAPKTIEALICAQNWFRSKPLSMKIEECADDIEKLELGGDNGTTSGSGKQVLEV
ncbi:zinc finger BED domain-containing protein RICESLEEPER 2-like [Senna tora]|uniref:Zinc finger BED domain-containing protein RICESLEEPER 2-like n=1 Tax=Senna tora TaxID=362788 RepID=A0A834WYB3_9FABA|nr:zinc finger BED domain-containing protein RICESLEEPER 2-like [Senna tora]